MSIRKNFEIKFFKLGIQNLIIWFVNFILTSFTSITIYFLYFSGTIKLFLLNSNASPVAVNLFYSFIVLVAALVLIYISLVLTSFLVTSKINLFKWLFGFINLSAFSLAVIIWVYPQLLINTGVNKSKTSYNDIEFTFGSYPGREELYQLKKQGYKSVITLMHPENYPFESKLLREELNSSKEVGIELISIPLIPGYNYDKNMLKNVDAIFEKEKGKYFVHEFNNEGRVNLFRNLIDSDIKEKVTIDKNNLKKLTDTKFFEKGNIIKLDDGIYFTPYPNGKEVMDFIVTPGVKSVVCLVNEKNPVDSSLLNEKKILDANSIPFIIKTFTEQPYDPSAVFESSLFVRGLPRPVVIHTFDLNSVISEGFILSYKNQKKSFPSSLFKAPLQNGTVAFILPNVLAGPKPTIGEYKTRLFNCGVRGIIFCDTIKKSLTVNDRTFFTRIGLSWEQIEFPKLSSRKEITSGGLWYIYGADSTTIRKYLK